MYSLLLVRVWAPLVPMLCSDKSLWRFLIQHFPCMSYIFETMIQQFSFQIVDMPQNPGETWSEYSMVKTETKVLMKVFE